MILHTIMLIMFLLKNLIISFYECLINEQLIIWIMTHLFEYRIILKLAATSSQRLINVSLSLSPRYIRPCGSPSHLGWRKLRTLERTSEYTCKLYSAVRLFGNHRSRLAAVTKSSRISRHVRPYAHLRHLAHNRTPPTSTLRAVETHPAGSRGGPILGEGWV